MCRPPYRRLPIEGEAEMPSNGNERRSNRLLAGALCACCLLVSLPALAQYGFPLVGTWSGYWGPDDQHRTRVLVAMSFSVDQVISGFIVEKGVRIPIKNASLDPNTWTVTMEAERTEAATGKNVKYLITGAIENLGSATERAIAGTWKEGTESGDFRVVIN
jgi:hypothetical protein